MAGADETADEAGADWAARDSGVRMARKTAEPSSSIERRTNVMNSTPDSR